MKRAFAFCLLLAATPAKAWTVTTERDPMTDKNLTWARVTAQDATLLVGCLNGRPDARLTWPESRGFGTSVGVTYRYDDGPVTSNVAGMFSQGGRTFYYSPHAAENVAKLRTAKRLRVQISGGQFYDFKLTGGDAFPTKWSCK